MDMREDQVVTNYAQAGDNTAQGLPTFEKLLVLSTVDLS